MGKSAVSSDLPLPLSFPPFGLRLWTGERYVRGFSRSPDFGCYSIVLHHENSRTFVDVETSARPGVLKLVLGITEVDDFPSELIDLSVDGRTERLLQRRLSADVLLATGTVDGLELAILARGVRLGALDVTSGIDLALYR